MSAESSVRWAEPNVAGSKVVPEIVPPESMMCAENGVGRDVWLYQNSPDHRPVRSVSREKALFSGTSQALPKISNTRASLVIWVLPVLIRLRA